MDKVSTIWATNHLFNPPGFFINEDPDIDNSVYPWHVRNFNPGDWRGWNMVYSQDQITINDTATPVYGYGFYKISTNASSAHFYIDYRDTRIPYENVIHIGQNVDHWVKYDFSNNKFYISPISLSGPYTEISNGAYIPFWELKQTNPAMPSTAEFPDYWENCLASIYGSGYPRIVWGRHPQDDIEIEVDNYKIYRAVSSGIPPQNPNFTHIATVGSDIYSFIDYDFASGGPLNLQYMVTAIYEDLAESVYETSPTNTVLINGSLYKDNYKNEEKIEFFLSNNYPNPFNPITNINYIIENDGLVTLKVFDILGNEIATVLNEYRSAGKYQIQFNGAEIPSGIYFYTLISGNDVSTKKLILLK